MSCYNFKKINAIKGSKIQYINKYKKPVTQLKISWKNNYKKKNFYNTWLFYCNKGKTRLIFHQKL